MHLAMPSREDVSGSIRLTGIHSASLQLLTDITGCFKNSFTTLKACMNLFKRHAQCFELSFCSKTHRVLPGIVTVQCDFYR
jgi:hypothetical protein